MHSSRRPETAGLDAHGLGERSVHVAERNGRVAIYERDELMFGLLREWLSGAGYRVEDFASAADPTDAVALVIVSIALPKQASDALLRHVQAIHPQSPIIVLTSSARSGLSSAGAAARALGVERVMAKPLTRAELLAAVHDIAGRKPRP
jgi:DNA-binding response OmpR family regulator